MRRCLVLALLLSGCAAHVQTPNNPTSWLDPPLTQQQIATAMVQAHHEGYVHRVLVGFDQFAGAVIGLQNDQTISSATEIAAHKGNPVAIVLNDGLDLLERSHGQKAQAGDLERTVELRQTDALALTRETGVVVIPTLGGAELKTPGNTLKVEKTTVTQQPK